jgi:hypothetical protein
MTYKLNDPLSDNVQLWFQKPSYPNANDAKLTASYDHCSEQQKNEWDSTCSFIPSIFIW